MATYYVGIGGNDANNGTSWALRKLTIQAAVNIATTAGDTVLVSPGTYREAVTMGTSGTAGNVISLIGDYTGANTSGTKGVVRITRSTDDIADGSTNAITATSKNYITISGFCVEGSTAALVNLSSCTFVTVTQCLFCPNGVALNIDGASQASISVTRCYFGPNGNSDNGEVLINHSATLSNVAHLFQNCIFNTTNNRAIRIIRVGGFTVNNCTFVSGGGVYVETALAGGQTVTVNNCIFSGSLRAVRGTVTGEIVENYNTFYNCQAARTNVDIGANSVTRPPLFDSRWFFEMVNGGRLVTPFDLASYSTLAEYNSGTGAPATDMRGASVVGTYREWGALEYDANYRIGGPVSIAPIGGIG